MTYDEQLVALLVRVAVAASVASVLARFGVFLRLLLREDRSLVQQSQLAFAYGVVFAACAAVRALSPGYEAVDISLAGALLAGLTGGYWTGLLAGVVMSVAPMFAREWMTMPMLAGFGLLGGLLRDLAPDPEEIWRFSPVFDLLSGYRIFRRGADLARSGFQLLYLCSILIAVFLYTTVSDVFGDQVLHSIVPPEGPFLVVGYLTMLMCVALPLKIWNSTRTEKLLEARNRLLSEARLAALTNQINPHFLFNTLNSIASLIRLNPDQARQVIYRLSNILRRLLRKVEATAPLRDELAFIDDYLGIEMVRFGSKLKFEKDIDPETLGRPVPAMMLQPIVENSIRHGLAPKVEGGTIWIRSRLQGGKLRVTVEDDGVGMAEDRLRQLFESGVGVSNVNERLRVLFEDSYRIVVESRPGEGTRTEIDLPDLGLMESPQPQSETARQPVAPAAR
jgi:two-component system LytT family sensor kinase